MIILKKIIRCRELFKIVLLSGVMFCSIQATQAQVTIGSNQAPNSDALLDLQQAGTTTKGLLLPRVALEQTTSFNPLSAHVAGMVVYNTATTGDVTPGYYYNDGVKWMRLMTAEGSFFYMPSTILPTDENDPSFDGTKFSIDIYGIYSQQFGLTASNSVASDPSQQLPVYARGALYYFVTYYDESVFDAVAISTGGVLTYKLKPSFVQTEKTFMKIVCKVK